MERAFALLGRRRLVGVGLAFGVEAALLVAIAWLGSPSLVGISGAVTAAIAGSVAVAIGPWDGALVAFGGAVVFAVANGTGGDIPAALVVWPAIVVPVGFVGRRVAEQRLALGQIVVDQEQERQRLAAELHDDTAQSLAAALLALRALDAAETPAQAEHGRAELRELLQLTLQRVRALAVDLRPRSLDDLGLPAAAETLAATFTARTGLPVEIELDHGARLPSPVELQLYRVLQEALQDVDRHRDATRVRVTLRTSATGTVFEVADDGSVDDAAGAVSKRLASARERLRLVGGRLTVLTPPGDGTIVRATIPVPNG